MLMEPLRSGCGDSLEEELCIEPGPEELNEGYGAAADADSPQEIDEYKLVDPVEIDEKSGFWAGVKATKWSERKEALITDVHIAVAVEAIQAIGNLARGLRTAHFSGNSRFMLPVLLEKLKEKNTTLTNGHTQTLQAMYKSRCLNLATPLKMSKLLPKINFACALIDFKLVSILY
ncbi:hypothetical protein POM88_030053 [Heracleum sosnowskyi]|uniref:Uncharacterized protein n=1 Tax=Heracleum sosnowskyi TaxID=360622 RepID=A0AAD8MFE7_9APIA|nr:hypothetical protein POM88_030053 [Heracleum sosnowskyi]